MEIFDIVEGRVAIKPLKEETKVSRGGVVLIENKRYTVKRGKVISIGKESNDKQRLYGRCVLYDAFGAIEVELNGETIFVVKEEDILGTLQEKK